MAEKSHHLYLEGYHKNRKDKYPEIEEEKTIDDSETKVTPLYPVHLLKMVFIKDHSFCGPEDKAQIHELQHTHNISHYRNIFGMQHSFDLPLSDEL